MLKNSELIAFSGTAKPEQAREFYEEILGLEFVDANDFALVFRAGGTMLRIAIQRDYTPPPGTILGWRVSDIESILVELKQKGVAPDRFEGMGQDENGVWHSPDGAKIAWFQDPDENTLSITQF